METARLTPIDEALIERVRDRILEACQPQALYMFGSAARGETTEGSDLDLLVVMDLPDGVKSYEMAGELGRLFDGWLLPLDILVQTPADFERTRHYLGHIARIAIREGRVLYRRDEDD